MKKCNKTIKYSFFNGWLYFIVLLFFIPFFGDFGGNIFRPFGKYYYVALFFLAMSNIVCRVLFNRPSINKVTINVNHKFLALSVIVLIIFVLCVINDSLIDFIFLIILCGFFLFFISYKFTSRTLHGISNLADILLILLLFFSLIKKFDYFNPNTYAEIATVLFFLSCVGYNNTSKHKLILFIKFVMAIYIAEIIYHAETQLITLLFFAVIMVFRSKFLKDSKHCKIAILIVWLFTMCLPFVVYGLIELNFFSQSVFTNRGERWVSAIDAFKTSGLFVAVKDLPGAHNGFLDVAIKYTFFGAVVLAICLINVMFKYCKYMVRRDDRRVNLCAVLAIVFMNCVESLFVGLVDSYFLIILLGISISCCLSEKKVKKEVKAHCGKIHYEKCHI